MDIESITYFVCHDCFDYLNAFADNLDDQARANCEKWATWETDDNIKLLKAVGFITETYTWDMTGDRIEFSTQTCELCRSMLAGKRFKVNLNLLGHREAA